MDSGYWTYSKLTKSEKKNFCNIYKIVGVDWLSRSAKYMCKKDTCNNLDLELVRYLVAHEKTDKDSAYLALYEDKVGKLFYVSLFKNGVFLNTTNMFSQPFVCSEGNIGRVRELAGLLNAEFILIEELLDKSIGGVRLKKMSLLNDKLAYATCLTILLIVIVFITRGMV